MKKLMPFFFLVFTFLFYSPQIKAETTPSIDGMDPEVVVAGSDAFGLTIAGNHFDGRRMKVYLDGNIKAINESTDYKINITVNAEEVVETGLHSIKVFWKNAAGNYIRISSDDFALKVVDRLPTAPVDPSAVEIVDITPRSIAQGSEMLRLVIKGRHMNAFRSEVSFDGRGVEIVGSNENELIVKVPADLLREARTLTVKVVIYTSEDSPLIKTYEFKVVASEESRHINADGATPRGQNSGASPLPDASGSGCSMLAGTVSGNAWFLILGFFLQMGMYLKLRK